MKIRILNPISHDQTYYDRGVHDLPDALAQHFLSYRHVAEKVHEDTPVKAPPLEAAETPAPLVDGTKALGAQTPEQAAQRLEAAKAAKAPLGQTEAEPEAEGTETGPEAEDADAGKAAKKKKK
jgi:hypothetical protein